LGRNGERQTREIQAHVTSLVNPIGLKVVKFKRLIVESPDFANPEGGIDS
jgi:hypothetical protein